MVEGFGTWGEWGQGPGGGGPNEFNGVGAHGVLNYVNRYLQPLVGGSGGGGGGAGQSQTAFGGNGGGGGGAILISSSRDVQIVGGIDARGGQDRVENRRRLQNGGNGSGGAVRVQADRITLAGAIGVEGGGGSEGGGLVRLEAYKRTLVPGYVVAGTSPILAPPTETRSFDQPGRGLTVVSVAGKPVSQPPRGDLEFPDVIFAEAGEIAVKVQSAGIPDGSPVRLRVTSGQALIVKPADAEPAVRLSGGVATFTLTVPQGRGTIQATSEFTTGSAP